MKNIYFARAIRGVRTTLDYPVYQTIKSAIRTAGHNASMDLKPNLKKGELEWDAYIYQRDVEWLDRSDAMIAEVSGPSTGVGYEIAYARHTRRIPILFLAAKDSSVSAMISGSAKVYYYRDQADLSNAVELFLHYLDVIEVPANS